MNDLLPHQAGSAPSDADASASASTWMALFQAMPAAGALVDLDGRLLALNAAARDCLGVTDADPADTGGVGLDAAHAGGDPLEAIRAAADASAPIRCTVRFSGPRREAPGIEAVAVGITLGARRACCLMWQAGAAGPDRSAGPPAADHEAPAPAHATDLDAVRTSLAVSEERLRLAVAATDAGAYDWDLVEDRLQWDARTRELFSVPPGEDPSYALFLDRLHPEDRAWFDAHLPRYLSNPDFDGTWRVQYRVRQPDGRYLWIDSPGRIHFEGEGAARRPSRFTGLVFDITERVETARRLAASEERLRLAVSSSTLGWWEMDPATRRLDWSENARRMFGYAQADPIPLQDPVQRIHADDRARVIEAIDRALDPAGDGQYRERYRIHHPDGSLRWVAAVGATHFRDQDDGVRVAARFAGVLWDVTERESLVARIADREARLHTILETVPVGIVECEAPSGRILGGNPRAAEIFGHPVLPSESIAQYAQWQGWHADGRPVEPEEWPMARLILDDVDRAQMEVHYQVAPDGTRRWIRLVAAALRNPASGAITGGVVVSLDIDAERRAMEALREADRRKDEFLAMLAHELRNPLAPIVNGVKVLDRREALSATGQTVLDMIGRQTRHMKRLVDDLLEVSRITRGKIELQPEPVLLQAIVHDAIEVVMPAADARRQRLVTRLPERIVRLVADPVRLVQVLENLLTNAIKYTPEEGLIEVEATAEGSQAVVRVRDTGIGLSADVIDQVFDLFIQVPAGQAFSQGGLGIGLAMVKKLVAMHGGSVKAQSDGPGRGSTFTVVLPLDPAHATIAGSLG